MEHSLPKGLQSWLAHRGWLVVQDKPVVGGFAASIFRLRVRQESGAEIDVIYKKFAPDRVKEGELYRGVLRHFPGYVPHLFAHIDNGEEQGILLAYAGLPIKAELPTTRDEVEKTSTHASSLTMMNQVARWLAEFHVSFETQSQVWLAAGQLGEYPIDSAQSWGIEAIEHMQWLLEQEFVGVELCTVLDVKAMVNAFYAVYPRWLSGRTTITHGDPHLENLLRQEGRLCLIDWEYACVTVPQRDLSILLQDVLDENLHRACRSSYWDYLREHGWAVDDPSFETTYQACFFDNTLMMLGWEIYKYRQGFLRRRELEIIVGTKIQWLYESFRYLFPHSHPKGPIRAWASPKREKRS